ncbi:YecA family protein [Calidifontibacillus erzurumensis]|uniref:SEC-C domain-containing protein n=1 Tax=Calidifontibacillus erzurumensis TaxID=2741433 RepID=A0A8J8KDQ1_9BACI|nr:SEC-C domain-containing protein [Calidifontibacillus erzurumensis]NSL53243.1 SEC-C domain-containing protein [Calidifontibacillus erzurumensis]
MFNIKRNDPCYCGSGKKFKKCCAARESNESQVAILEREVVQAQSELFRYSFSHPVFKAAVQQKFRNFNPPEKMRDSFYFFVGVWMLFSSKILNGKTSLEQYCLSRLQTARPQVQDIVRSWIGGTPSAATVVSVDGRQIVVRDLFTSETKNVKIIDTVTEVPKQGAFLFGYIVPFLNDVSTFFTSVLSYEDEMADKVESLVRRKYAKFMNEQAEMDGNREASAFLQQSFLELVDLFMSDRELDEVDSEDCQTFTKEELGVSVSKNNQLATDCENGNERKLMEPTHFSTGAISLDDTAAAVVNLLEEKAQSVDLPESVVETGNTLWQKYYYKKQPLIKNEKIYAAALHYLLVDKVFPHYRRTQKATAELYEASLGSVSNRSREMACVLEEELRELCVNKFDSHIEEQVSV